MAQKTRMVGVRCRADLLRQLDLAAAATHHSRSTVLTEAIAQFCDVLDAAGENAMPRLTLEEAVKHAPLPSRHPRRQGD